MKKFYIIFLGIFIGWNIQQSNAQSSTWQWAKSAGGVGGDEGKAICTDANGNVYATGCFYSPVITFGSISLTNVDNTGNTPDMYLVKYNAQGNVIWAKKAGGFKEDQANSVATDTNGNIYVTGYFRSPFMTFGSFTLANTDTCCNTIDIFMAKYDSSGNLLWAKKAGGNGADYGSRICVDAIGNFYITGSFYSSPIVFDNITLGGMCCNADIFVVKYDTNGNVIWAKSAGGTELDSGGSICTDANGNVFVTGGYKSGTITFGSFTLTNLYPGSYFYFFVVKYDASGNVLWAKSAGGPGAGNDFGRSISVDTNGNAYVTGAFFSSSITFGSTTLNNNGACDVFVVKYGAGGNVIWAKSAGEEQVDDGMSITVEDNGNSYVTGYFYSSAITFDSITLANTEIYTTIANIFIVKYDVSGNVIWAQDAGGDSYNVGASISIDASTNVFVTGYFESSIMIFGNTTLANSASIGSDVFVAKICQMAMPTISTSGSTTFCQGDSITLTASSANAYLWSNGATTQSIILSTPGNYSVTVTNLNGCSLSSFPTNITVNHVPTSSITPSGATTFCQGDSITLTASSANSYLWSNGTTTQSIVVSNAGSYSVDVTNSCGSDTSSVMLIVKTSPPTPTITASGATTFCQGEMVMLTASSANSYLWSNGAIVQTISISSSGNFAVIVTNGNGCSSISSYLDVIVNPLPNAIITANDSILTSSSSTGNQWYLNGNFISGATTQNYIATQNGYYTVMVTDGNGCTSTSAQYNYTSIGIEVFLEHGTVSVIQNPTTGKFEVKSDKLELVAIDIYDLLGEKIYQCPITNKDVDIDFSNQQNGIYFINIKTKQGIISKKLILQQ